MGRPYGMSRELRRALAFVFPYRRSLALVAFLSIVSTALSLAIPYLSKTLVDRALVGGDRRWLYWTVALFAATSALGYVLTAVVGLRYTRLSADILFDMRLALYRHLQRLSPRFYARTPLGDILSRINNDVGEVQRVAAESLLGWVGNLLFLIGSMAAMVWLDLRLALVGLALVPAAVWALVRTRARLADHVRSLRESSAAVGSFLIETLQGLRLVVASNAERYEIERFRDRNHTFVEALLSMQWWSYVSGSAPGLILSAGTAMVFLYGGHRVIEGTMSLGTFVAFLAYYMQLMQPVRGLMGLYGSLATVQVSLTRVYELLDTPPDVVEAEKPRRLTRVEGAIDVDRVSLDLGRGEILRSASFRVAPGETLAIMGPSGAGKSTIADLLVRFIDPDEGSIRLDGLDLREIALEDLRRHVVLVDQEPTLFHATLAENIRYARPEAPTMDVLTAAGAAGLDELLARLPDGLQTIVGERGLALSVGERQRIAVARALLVNPSVLILDEPTAALDTAAERQVLAGYERVMRGRTTIVITHHQALASAADRVVIVADGAIVDARTYVP